LVFLAVFFYTISSQNILNGIKQRITNTGLLNEYSLGAALAQQLNTSLKSYQGIAVSNCSFQMTTTTLSVQCKSMIWRTTHLATWFIWQSANGNLAIGGQFVSKLKLTTMASKVTESSLPIWIYDVHEQEEWQFSFASGAGSPNGIPVGVFISVTKASINGTFAKNYQQVLPGNQDSVSASLQIPVFSSNPLSISLQITRKGQYQTSRTITITQVQITANLPSNFYLDLQFTAKLRRPSGDSESLNFDVSGQMTGGQTTLTGKLLSTWTTPFGIKWLTITSASLTLTLGQTDQLALQAVGLLKFSPQPVTVLVTIGGPSFEDILFAIEGVKCNKQVEDIYALITGKHHAALKQVQIQGIATIAISTFSSQGFQEGFTLMVDATLTEGLMKSTVNKLSPITQTFVYQFSMFLPIFTEIAIDLSLTETGSFAYSKKITINSYKLVLDLGGGDTQFDLQANINTLLSDGQTLKLDVSASINENSGLNFQGTTLNEWDKPFGLKWMNLQSGASVVLNLGEPFLFKVHGVATLSWVPGSSVTFDLQIGGPDLDQDLFSLQGIPWKVTTLDRIIHEVTGKSFTEIQALDAQGTYSIILSTFQAPQGNRGFTFKSHVTVVDTMQPLARALSVLVPFRADLVFDLSLYIPLFDDPLDIQFDLTETGTFRFNRRINITDYGLHVHVGSLIEIQAGMDIQFEKDNLHFDITTEFNEAASSFTFNGVMSGKWIDPFGRKWLVIDGVTLDIVIGGGQLVQQFNLDGQGTFTWSPTDHGTADISLTTSSDFTSDTLEAKITNQYTVLEITKTIAGQGVSHYLSEIETTHNLAIDFILSTSSGITLQLDGTVTGSLKQVFHRHLYWLPNQPGDSFHLFINIPVFSSNPLGITLGYNEKVNTQISKHIWFEGFTFALSVLSETVSLDAQMIGKWNSNPPLQFEMNGSFGPDAGLVLWGDMMGTWENAFGFKGFELSNVIGQLGFSLSACSFGCVSQVGIGAQFQMGNSLISFDGELNFPEFWDIFLAGKIVRSNGNKLAVADVIDKWNFVTPSHPVSKENIPGDWGMTQVSFYLAPEDGQLGPIHFTKGFGVTGIMELLSMYIYVSVNCTGSSFTCDFAFDCTFSLKQFEHMILHELSLMYPGRNMENNATFTFFKLNSVTLTKWSQENIAYGTHPEWYISFVSLNKPQATTFQVRQYELSHSFHVFFVTWLKHLF